MHISTHDRMTGGLWGSVIGDALGVPVEFQSREQIKRNPVTDLRGGGTHGQLPGTWSDDSSLLLCTVESLAHGFDPQDLTGRFQKWFYEGYWSARGRVFDIGITTREALRRFTDGIAAEQAGSTDERSNGNGSLMRILPVALKYHQEHPRDLLKKVHCASAITHGHPRSQMSCMFYCLLVRELLSDRTPEVAVKNAIEVFGALYASEQFARELTHFNLLTSGQLANVEEDKIRSSGYVVDTLTSSIWCLLHTSSFSEAVLRAVNLGDDTDTTGCVTGGLAGVVYGIQAIPEPWRVLMAKSKDLAVLFEAFARSNTHE